MHKYHHIFTELDYYINYYFYACTELAMTQLYLFNSEAYPGSTGLHKLAEHNLGLKLNPYNYYLYAWFSEWQGTVKPMHCCRCTIDLKDTLLLDVHVDSIPLGVQCACNYFKVRKYIPQLQHINYVNMLAILF